MVRLTRSSDGRSASVSMSERQKLVADMDNSPSDELEGETFSVRAERLCKEEIMRNAHGIAGLQSLMSSLRSVTVWESKRRMKSFATYTSPSKRTSRVCRSGRRGSVGGHCTM